MDTPLLQNAALADSAEPGVGVPPSRALTPFVYSFVEYDSSSLLSTVFALSGLYPLFVLSAFVTLIASRRDLHTATFLLGQLANEAVNHVLKYAIQAPRPPPGHPAFDAQSPYALPSDHAQFAAFFAAYYALWAPMHWSVGPVWKALGGGLCAMAALVVGVGRVYLGYHTLFQVACGWLTGVAVAVGWFAVTERVLRPRFAAVAQWQLARWLWIRDLTHSRNVLKQEYEAASRSGKGVLLF